MGNFLEDLLVNVEFAEALMDRLVAIQKDFFDTVLAELGDLLEVVCMGDDLATQRGLMLSPAGVPAPDQAATGRGVRLRQGKVPCEDHASLLRGGGPFIGDLIEIGVDILNPVQPLAEGMDRGRS